jgi:hypothetical protein
MGYGLVNGFIDLLYTPLGTTSNYSATFNLHTLQITTAPAKPFPACCVLTWQQLLTVDILQLSALRSSCRSLPCITQLSTPELLIEFSAETANYLLVVSSQSSSAQSQSQSYFTTGGLPPISSSWRQAP